MRNVYEKARFSGRPYALDPNKVKLIADLFRKTLVLGNIAGTIGHHRETVKNWLEQGEADHLAHENTIFAELFVLAKKSIAARTMELEEKIETDRKGWQRYAWLLERTVRRDYSIYGEIWDEFEQRLNGIVSKHAERDEPIKPREISKEVRDWVKAKMQEKRLYGEVDTESDQEKRCITQRTGSEEGQENPSE